MNGIQPSISFSTTAWQEPSLSTMSTMTISGRQMSTQLFASSHDVTVVTSNPASSRIISMSTAMRGSSSSKSATGALLTMRAAYTGPYDRQMSGCANLPGVGPFWGAEGVGGLLDASERPGSRGVVHRCRKPTKPRNQSSGASFCLLLADVQRPSPRCARIHWMPNGAPRLWRSTHCSPMARPWRLICR